MLTQLSDEALLERSAAGDEDAFTTLYHRRQGAIYRFALHMSGSNVVAEDVTQETFVALIRGGFRFSPERGPLLPFLFGMARNLVRSHLRHEGDSPDEELETAVEDNSAEWLCRAETIEAVRQAVLCLPDSYREAVVLCDLEELSYENAAVVLGRPVGTVRSRVHRGRALLARKLRAQSVRCGV